MHPLRILASLTLFALCTLIGIAHGMVPALALATLGSAALMVTPPDGAPSGALFTATLTPTILLQQTIRALFVKVPALMFFASEFTTDRLKKGQTVTGKIRLRPTSSVYDANNGGYKAGSQESRDLLVDVPFTMDKHIHVTVKLSHLYALADSIQKLEEHMQDSASVIGKEVVRYVLGKVGSPAFSNASTYSTANSNKDALNAIRKSMNTRGVPDNRFGIVNSDVFETLAGDSRITNRYDGRSMDTDGQALGHLMNISGFQHLLEDPELDDNTDAATKNITGVASTDVITADAAHGQVVNDRVQIASLAGGTGMADGYFFVKTVPSTTTLTLAATRGGDTVDFTSNITGGTIKKADNITGFFGTREAVAIKTGLPTDSIEVAQALGIPVPASSDVVTDPDSGLSMMAYKWFEPNTMDAYITLTMLYGATAGQLADTGKYAMEPAGHILRSA